MPISTSHIVQPNGVFVTTLTYNEQGIGKVRASARDELILSVADARFAWAGVLHWHQNNLGVSEPKDFALDSPLKIELELQADEVELRLDVLGDPIADVKFADGTVTYQPRNAFTLTFGTWLIYVEEINRFFREITRRF